MKYRIHYLIIGLLMTAIHVCGNPVTDMLEKAIAGESVLVGDEEYDAVLL